MFITHFIACFIVGILFRFWKFKDSESIKNKGTSISTNNTVTFSNLGEILATSIMNSINTVVLIGGFVILFCVIISILNNTGILQFVSTIISNLLHIDINFIKPTLSGLIELTNGVNQISQIPTKSLSTTLVITSFLLGFGGISILLQVLSITSKSDISIKPYIIGKFLHGIIAAALTYLFIHIFPIFSLDILPISSPIVNNLTHASTYFYYSYLAILTIILITIFFIRSKRKVISKNIN